jgi:hypothetical protein
MVFSQGVRPEAEPGETLWLPDRSAEKRPGITSDVLIHAGGRKKVTSCLFRNHTKHSNPARGPGRTVGLVQRRVW